MPRSVNHIAGDIALLLRELPPHERSLAIRRAVLTFQAPAPVPEKEDERVCIQCHRAFVPKSHNQKFCTFGCSREFRQLKRMHTALEAGTGYLGALDVGKEKLEQLNTTAEKAIMEQLAQNKICLG